MSATGKINVVKVTFKFERNRWRLMVLKLPDGSKEPVLALHAKCDTLGAALDVFDDWKRGVVIV